MSSQQHGTAQHWSSAVNQAVVQRGPNGSFNLCIEGGSEYGQFVVIGDVLTDKVSFRSGRLAAGEIILEINGVHVAGYTQSDGIQLIRDSSSSLNITSVLPSHGITRDLRQYLSTRFPRGSLDHELQQTIRDNLYMRTVPCTTRKPRDGEVPGIDYQFLTVNEYLELEKSGKLLESGFYESNYYGTPKPPKQPMTPGTGTLRNPKIAKKQEQKRDGDLAPLPSNWEMAFTRDGEPYFVDHNSGKTQWDDPRKQKSVSTPRLAPRNNAADIYDDLPSGWEKVDDPKYGTYYIDHVNRRTQYEKPTFYPSRKTSQASRILGHDSPDRGRRDFDTQSKKSNSSIDTRKLQGETLRINLRKAAKGFGFTIVGGEQQGEVLQVNNIVRGGAADMDGRLRTGDIVMRLNGRNVLSWSHGDIIRFLQTTRVGEIVELDIVRGYALPYDSSETNSRKALSPLVNGERDNMKRALSNGSLNAPDAQRDNVPNQRSMLTSRSTGYLSDGEGYARNREGATTPQSFRSGPPQYRLVKVIRGPNGFGFTIADSPYGQRVKEIIDRQRCQDLVQGDVIIRINTHIVHNLDHSAVVEILKSCPKGTPSSFQVQRSGILTVVKSMPMPAAARRNQQRPKSMTNLDHDDDIRGGVRGSSSMGVIATAGETSTENTTTYEERTHPQVSAAGDGYKSLKRAVQSNARDTEALPKTESGSEHVITLKRGTGGFGFRIIGGQEEKTQVKIDTIVANGEADRDGRLYHGDEILAVDGINVIDATHKRVISLMNNAALNGKVTLRIRRPPDAEEKPNQAKLVDRPPIVAPVNGHGLINELGSTIKVKQRERRKSDTESIQSDKQVQEWIEDHQQQRDRRPRDAYRGFQANNLKSKSESNINKVNTAPPPVAPKPQPQLTKANEITLSRNANEGFGFVIMSSPSSKGSVIGRIIPGSPADRCGQLCVDDKLLAVNDQNVSKLSHSEIVSLVKNSGLQVKIAVDRSTENKEDDRSGSPPPPPRPAEPRNYTPSYSSYNKHNDTLRDDYSRQRPNVEDSRNREMQEKENIRQPIPRPKFAPNFNTGEPMEQSGRRSRSNSKHDISAEPFTVVLRKADRGFGFSIRGGDGSPLYILRIAVDGAAAIDGRIQVNDEILAINNEDTSTMTHADAVNSIRSCTEEATLLLRRPSPHSGLDNGRIPNGQPVYQR